MNRNGGSVPKTLTKNAWATSPRRLPLSASPYMCFHSTCYPQLSGGPGPSGCHEGVASVFWRCWVLWGVGPAGHGPGPRSYTSVVSSL